MKKETIINTLKGIAIGDAFGLGIEFKSRPWILENVAFDAFVNVWKGGKNNILPGYYSDDTEHSIGVAEALLDHRPFSKDLLLEKFKKEYFDDIKTKGHPRDGHGSIEKWYTEKETIEAVRQKQASRIDPGNAPVMRAVPLAFVPEELTRTYSDINANSTHPHEMARIGSYLTIKCAHFFLHESKAKEELVFTLLENGIDKKVEQEIAKLIELPAPEQLHETDYLFLHGEQPLPYISWDPNILGLPCASFRTALNVVYVLLHANTAFEALQYSVNMGGDIDSLAAVCTGIAAGKYGLDSLPSFLLEKTEGLERMEKLGSKLYDKFYN